MLLFVLSIVFAQNISDIPGLIPLTSIRQAASDLVYEGKVLNPEQAKQLVDSGKVKDLSLLDPDDKSILWKANPQNLPDNPEAQTHIQKEQGFDYLENNPEVVGRFGFAVSQKDQAGSLRIHRVRVEPRSHNVLLRRNLLRKLGYNIPATTYLPKMTINFKGNFSRDEFLRDLDSHTLYRGLDTWLVEKNNAQVVLQDVIVFSGAEDSFYNLARGDLTAATIQNRRIMNALLIPYNLTDITESINVFSWNPGKVFNNQLSLPYEESYIFSTSYEDARWITRRLLTLSRQDFEKIVQEAYYPIEVEKLLVEKLISRRNFLRNYLNLQNESVEIAVNTKVSYGENLKNGKLALVKWKGYAQNFSYGDPESPLGGDEMFAFFKSKTISNLLSNVIDQFNQRFLPRTDLGFKIYDHQLDLVVEQWAEYIRTGEVKKTPFAFYTESFFNTNLIAAREVITGSYLGTDNLVQLADIIGFNIDAGFYIGTDGVDAPFALSGSVKGFITKTYAHLKPINSIKLALKEPFRNLLVPKLKNDLAKKLDEVIHPSFQDLDEASKQDKITEVMGQFKSSLKVGESLIITNSLGGSLALNPAMGLTSRVAMYNTWANSQIVLSRLHILRRDENTIQVFKDPAHMNTSTLAIGLQAYVPIVTFKYNRKKGEAITKFYSININDKLDQNPQASDNIKSLARLLKSSKTDVLDHHQKPFVIKHRFKENSGRWDLFYYRYLNLRSEDWISVTHPNGYTKDYLRRTTGRRSGKNYEALAIDTLNSLVREYISNDLLIATNSSGDSADSIYGKSVSQLFSFEAEIREQNSKSIIVDPFINLTYKWRDWHFTKKKLMTILFDINQRFDYEFFHESDLQQTDSIQLGTVEISINIYEDGIHYLSGFSRQEMQTLVRSKGVFPSYVQTPMDREGSQVRRLRLEKEARRNQAYIAIFGDTFEKFKSSYSIGDVDKTIEYLSKFVTFAERLLPSEDFYAIFGGEANLFVRSQIIGFREGDERQDRTLISNSYGQIGSQKGNGPLKEIQNQIGITESEFFIYWLLNKI